MKNESRVCVKCPWKPQEVPQTTRLSGYCPYFCSCFPIPSTATVSDRVQNLTSEVVGKWWWGYAFTGSFCCPANTHPFLKKWFDSKLLDSIEKGRERREWEGFRQSPVWVVRKNQMEILGVAREDGRTDHLTELVWPCVRCNWNLHFVAECLEWLPSIQEGMELLRRAPF